MLELSCHWDKIISHFLREDVLGNMGRGSYCLSFDASFDDLPRLGYVAHPSADVQESAGFQNVAVVPVWRRSRG